MPVYETLVSEAIRNTRGVLEAAVRLVSKAVASSAASAPQAVRLAPERSRLPGERLVGITSCPTGIAHTFMAAEALQKQRGRSTYDQDRDTGSVGAKNQLTPEDIAEADAVIIAAETKVTPHASPGSRSTH